MLDRTVQDSRTASKYDPLTKMVNYPLEQFVFFKLFQLDLESNKSIA